MATKNDPDPDSLQGESKAKTAAAQLFQHMEVKNRYVLFALLVGGILFFFGCHNFMQELIMHLPGFKVSSPILFQTPQSSLDPRHSPL